MKRLIYTAVFGGYDRVYPPVRREDADHVLVTDQAKLAVPGWQTMTVDASEFPTSKAANHFYRALIHRVLPGYDTSLYLDGNFRLLRETGELFDEFERSGAALGAWAHPRRSTVAEEVQAVIEQGKVQDAARVTDELDSYLADGFPDDVRLVQTGLLFKDHHSAQLDAAMGMWSELFRKHLARDQLSLPYVIWKTGLAVHLLDQRSRKKGNFFAHYPHVRGIGAKPRYAHVVARSYDSKAYRIVLKLWRGAEWLGGKLRPGGQGAGFRSAV